MSWSWSKASSRKETYTKPLHERSITQADCAIGQGVDAGARIETRGTARLVSA